MYYNGAEKMAVRGMPISVGSRRRVIVIGTWQNGAVKIVFGDRKKVVVRTSKLYWVLRGIE